MFGEIFYFELDGSLITTTIDDFELDHRRCFHERDVCNEDGVFETQQFPSLVRNYVFMECLCCSQKFFFNRHNAQYNLRERLTNFSYVQTLRAKNSIKQTVEETFYNHETIIRSNNILEEITNTHGGYVL